jgi:hypothetical protein
MGLHATIEIKLSLTVIMLTPTCIGFEWTSLDFFTWKYRNLGSLQGIMYLEIRLITSKSSPLLLRLDIEDDFDVDFLDVKYCSNCSRPIATNLKKTLTLRQYKHKIITVFLWVARTGYLVQWWDTSFMVGVQFLVGARDFSPLHSNQTDSGAHPASYQMGNRSSLARDKVAGAWSRPLTSGHSQSQEWWSYTSSPPWVHGVPLHWQLYLNLTFTLLHDNVTR